MFAQGKKAAQAQAQASQAMMGLVPIAEGQLQQDVFILTIWRVHCDIHRVRRQLRPRRRQARL